MQINSERLSLSFVSELLDGLARLSLSQCGEDHYIVRHFEKDQKPGFYMDVGAFHPRRYSNTYLLRTYFGWRGINIDGNPDAVQLFQKAAPNDINLHAAIDETEREVEFVVYRGAAHSTLDDARKAHNANIDVKTRLNMTTRTLDSVVAEYAPNTPIDFLSIDVEGRDLQALRSLNLAVTRPRLICIEDHDFIAALDKGVRTPTQQHMLDAGYRFVSHHTISSFYVPRRA